jgi:hypothetical protein
MADYPRITGTIAPTPRNRISGFLADLLELGAKGYDVGSTLQAGGPVTEGRLSTPVSDLLGIPELQRTLNRVSYNEPLTTGTGYTTRLRPDTVSAAMTVAPMVGPAAKAGAAGARMAGTALKDLATSDVAYNAAMNAMRRSGGMAEMLPQEDALMLAQRRAALPVSQGGLGLPASNTAEQRARAMGSKEAVHFSRHGGDYEILDSGKFAIAPFDAVGTHVGTPKAAAERFENTVGYKINNPNYASDELKGVNYPVEILGEKPLLNQNQMPWGEEDLNQFLRRIGGHDASESGNLQRSYREMNADLRDKLFKQQGYTSIPYFNEVEGKGTISYIVPPENLRSRFAAFDPFRRNTAIATAMGVSAPDLLAQEKNEKKKKK